MKILIIEDAKYKINNIVSLLDDIFPGMQHSLANSVITGKKAISDDTYDLLLLDMSLPTYDINKNDTGGRPKGFGGREILDFIKRKNIVIPVIIITQYEDFPGQDGVVSIKDLSREFKKEHTNNFIDIIYYDTRTDKWKDDLIKIMNKLKIIEK